jgi:hypothetical protein
MAINYFSTLTLEKVGKIGRWSYDTKHNDTRPNDTQHNSRAFLCRLSFMLTVTYV